MKPTPRNKARTSRARVRWQNHIATQQVSGQTQVAYCREHGLSDKYFSLWKRKLRSDSVLLTASPETPVLIPVSLTPKRSAGQAVLHSESAEPYSIRATLPNGIVIECGLPSAQALLSLFSQLAQLPC